ncbi:MAG: CPBP family intramembrane metalloprotease, partial [bacterium]|nr:CPBP family intramembrane metalloprotease [bacterium]
MNTQIEKKSKGKIFIGILGCIVPMLVFLGLQLAVGMVSGIVVAIATAAQSGSSQFASQFEYQINENIMSAMPVILLVTTLLTTIVGYLWYRLKYRERYDYQLKEVAEAKDYIYIIVAALAASFAIDIIIIFVTSIFPNALSEYSDLMEEAGIGSNIISFLTAAFLAPIGEECFFRGVIQRKAEKLMPFIAANILQALLFGIMHWNIVQSSYAFVLGLILGYIRYKYQSVKMGILFHMVFNILGQTLPMLLANTSDTVNIILAVISVPILGIILKLMSNVEISPKPYTEPQPQYAYGYGQPNQGYQQPYGYGQPNQVYQQP